MRTYVQSSTVLLRIIHGILLDKLVEEPAESKKEETFAMPRYRKYNDRYNGSPLTFYNPAVNLLIGRVSNPW